MNEIKLNEKDLIKVTNSVIKSFEDILKLIKSDRLEEMLNEKVNAATSKLNNYEFTEFWEIFIYLLNGEIELKTIVKEHINGLDNKERSDHNKLNGRVIVLSSLFIKFAHQLVEELYDFIVNYYKNSLKFKSMTEIDEEIDRMLKTIFSILKTTLNTSSVVVLQIIEDFKSSLLSAQNLGQKFIKD